MLVLLGWLLVLFGLSLLGEVCEGLSTNLLVDRWVYLWLWLVNTCIFVLQEQGMACNELVLVRHARHKVVLIQMGQM